MASNNIAQFVFLNLPTANKKTKLETNTAASPTSQDFPIPITIVYENNALYPIPGAIARGYLEKSPIRIDAIADTNAVAKKTPDWGIPASPNIAGLTPKIYAIARKVVRPATISVFKLVYFHQTWKNHLTYDHLTIWINVNLWILLLKFNHLIQVSKKNCFQTYKAASKDSY